ncbi:MULTISPECIES: serine/threonine protein kinase [Nostocales]|uniref:Serine/threonine protein kinase n=3 Tax=Nostocales TaxID=1161 RepID=A0A8S9TCD0_9CYAN|nr:serine/threonine-protein kinase [Tolypothrix bouteillei]KAF3889254.1 serine/threonine protein kinase [Tolypothrix bouteillei VB521301]
MKPSSQSDPWIGRSIGDHQRYRLDKRLGAGGMGDVFLTMDTLLGQQVALKLLKDTLVTSGELRKRFEREVAVSAALKSDHIVQVTDYGVTQEGYPFYVMEYLRGVSLGQLLRREGRLSIEQTTKIISQVCDGLHLAHAGVTLWRNHATVSEHIQVVHRDLKPDNIFLVPTTLGELVKILDFGIAKIRQDSAEHTKLTNMFLGTYHYAAPEQLEVMTNLDGRADIYSLGIIIYEMLSGTDPFGLGFNTRRVTEISWAIAHTTKPAVPLRSLPGLSQLPVSLEALVMKCLQKSPDDRFATVDELKQALQAAMVVEGKTTPLVKPSVHSADDKTVARSPQNSQDKTIARPSSNERGQTILQPRGPSQTSNFDKTVRKEVVTGETIAQNLPPLEINYEESTVYRPLTPHEQEVSDAILSLEMDSLIELLSEVIGPIAPTLIQDISTRKSDIKDLVENLMLYLSLQQRQEFEKKAILFSQKPIDKTKPRLQNWQNQPVDRRFIRECEEDLAQLIGPIAPSLIQGILASYPQISPVEMVSLLVKQIPNSKIAEEFRLRILS